MEPAMNLRFLTLLIAAELLVAGASRSSLADEPLHTKINQVVEATAVGPVADRADDLTFLRRVSLDLIGRVPSAAEAKAFLADETPEKRTQLVDRLVNSADFSRHMAATLDIMLMERRAGKHVKADEFRGWLRKAIEANRSWKEIARDLLAADGSPGDNRPAAAFLMERDVEPNLLTREIGRMFFGIDLQCAQCHDHPNIDDYYQGDYYGLYAFVRRTSLFRPDTKKPGLLMESADGGASFKSVFTDRQATTNPRLPGEVEFLEPVFKVGDEYSVKPAKNVRHIPKYSRRAKLAELVATGNNRYFDRNISNRLWAIMLGRGLVQPVDQHHSDNPPTNPELLDLITVEFVTSNYNIRAFMREVALTDVYQRSYLLPENLADAVAAAKSAIPQKQAAVESASAQIDAGYTSSDAALAEVDAALAEATPLRAALGKVRAAAVEAAKKRDAAAAAQAAKEKAHAAKRPTADTLLAASNAAAAALAAFKDDKELAAAAAVLKKRSDPLVAEADKLKNEAEALKKPLADSQAKLDEAQKPVDAEQTKVAPVEEKIRQRRAALVTARVELENARTAKKHASEQLKYLQNIVTLGESEQALARVRPALAQAEPQNATAQAALATATQNMTVATTALTKARQEFQAADTARTTAEAELAAQQQGAKFAGESLASAKQALGRLADDAELKQAVAALTAANTRLASQAAESTTKVTSARSAAEQTKSALDQATATHTKATAEHTAAKQKAEAAAKLLSELQAELARVEPLVNEATDAIVRRSGDQFNIAAVEPLTPEQLAWSMLEATGYYDRIRAGERARLTKEKPLSEDDQKDAAKVAAREAEIEDAAAAKLLATVNKFVNLYANQKGQPQDAFFASAEQALFLANAGDVLSWLNPSGDNLTARLGKLEDPNALSEELYLSIFTRKPTAEETQSVNEYLTARKDDRAVAIREIAWALLTSVEFRFHH